MFGLSHHSKNSCSQAAAATSSAQQHFGTTALSATKRLHLILNFVDGLQQQVFQQLPSNSSGSKLVLTISCQQPGCLEIFLLRWYSWNLPGRKVYKPLSMVYAIYWQISVRLFNSEWGEQFFPEASY